MNARSAVTENPCTKSSKKVPRHLCFMKHVKASYWIIIKLCTSYLSA